MNKIREVLKAEVISIYLCFPLLFHLKNNMKNKLVCLDLLVEKRWNKVIPLSRMQA